MPSYSVPTPPISIKTTIHRTKIIHLIHPLAAKKSNDKRDNNLIFLHFNRITQRALLVPTPNKLLNPKTLDFYLLKMLNLVLCQLGDQ